MEFEKHKGKKVKDIEDLRGYTDWVESNVANKNAQVISFLSKAKEFMGGTPF